MLAHIAFTLSRLTARRGLTSVLMVASFSAEGAQLSFSRSLAA
jgi:hypothetical protein